MNLTFHHVSAAYRKRSILEDVSFSVDSGSVTALIGRNGVGKSTLINCLMGEKSDYSGKILLDGQDARSIHRNTFAHYAACLPQNLPRPHITVRELVSFGRTPHLPPGGRLSSLDEEIISRALCDAGMEQYSGAFVDQLSGGERKKAFFAMTLAQDTPLIILDEPTAHLDAVSRFEFLELIRSMCRTTNKTVLLVMHDLPDVLRCADRIVVLHDREIVFNGTAKQCLREEVPQRFFRIRIHGDSEHGFAVIPL